jgi:hypothetical protein
LVKTAASMVIKVFKFFVIDLESRYTIHPNYSGYLTLL